MRYTVGGMTKILSMEFLEAATERALKTAGQMGLFALGTQQWTQVGDVVNAGEALGVGMLFGLVVSYLTSMASAGVGNDGPSLANEALVDDVVHLNDRLDP